MTTTVPKIPTGITATEPVMLGAGIITTLVYVLQAAGVITVPEAQQLGPQLNAAVVAIWPLLIMVGGYIGRHFASSPATVAQIPTSTSPVTTAPVDPQQPAPVTTSTGGTHVALTINGTSDLPDGTTGKIAANTDRWALDGTKLDAVGPSTIALAAIDDVSGSIHGHFYRTAMAKPYYVEMGAVNDVTSPEATVPPVTPPPPAFDPNAPYPGNPSVTIAQAAAIDASYQVAKLRPDAGPTSAALAAFDGAAAKYGYNGVVGISIPGGQFLAVFVKGRIVGSEQGTGTTDTVALGKQYGLTGMDFGTVSGPAV